MSRCFPYPPPGYEPSPRSEHKDLLKKERHKGKKHKKKNGRERGERKGKNRDHKKTLKREKRSERKKNKDRNKDNHQTFEQETQKTGDFDHGRLKERKKHEVLKDIKCSYELVAQFPGQGHPNNKVNSNSELLPRSSKGFGAAASKQNEMLFNKMVKTSGHSTQNCHDLVLKNDSFAHTNKNGKGLQVGSAEKYFSKMHNSKLKQMERNDYVNEENKADNLMHLACPDEQKFTSDDVKKRKEFDANSTLHENGIKTTKIPRMSPTNISCVNGKTSPHSQGITPYLSTELVCAHTEEVDWHMPQDCYSDGITGYLKQQKVSVSSSVYSNGGYPKPPHLDTMYLSQVQSVPPREDISECIDQDWLFLEDPVERKTASFEVAESHQVWSDAQVIDTADIVALPYVVPL